MDINLNFQQKAAISQFLNHLTKPLTMMKWDKEKLFDTFGSYSLSSQTGLDYYNYVYTLKTLPFAVKRDIVCKILNSWRYAAQGDPYTLYQTLQDILYLKIETGVECVLFNNILNLRNYLDVTSISFHATSEMDYYMIDMILNIPDVDSSETQIRFTTSSEMETPRVEYSIAISLLKKKKSFTMQPSQEDVSRMLQVLAENKTKKHCPWIYLNYSLKCEYIGPFMPSLFIRYENIQYVDNNGE